MSWRYDLMDRRVFLQALALPCVAAPEVRLLNDVAVALVVCLAARSLTDESRFCALPFQKPGAAAEVEALQLRGRDVTVAHGAYCVAWRVCPAGRRQWIATLGLARQRQVLRLAAVSWPRTSSTAGLGSVSAVWAFLTRVTGAPELALARFEKNRSQLLNVWLRGTGSDRPLPVPALLTTR